MNRKMQLLDFARKHSTLLVFGMFVLLTLIFTYPLISTINSQIPEGRGDTFQAVSNIDSRVSTLAQTQGFSHKVLFLAKNINTFLPYVLLNLILNKYLAYNLMFFASFALSGLGMYLLALRFTQNKWASFLAGVIFAFAPFHFYEATVVNLGTMQQQWLPFYVLFLFKFFKKFRFRYFAGTVFFAFLIAMSEHQFLAFTVLFTAVFLIFKIIEDKKILKNKTLWMYAGVAAVLLTLAAFFLFGQLLKVATSDNNFLNPGMNAANKYSMGSFDPLLPPPFHAVWPGFNGAVQNMAPGFFNGNGSYFAGFSVLAVIGYFLMKLLKGIRSWKDLGMQWKQKKPVYFWLAATIIFYFFSLGPSFSIGKHTMYLPYFLVYKLLPFYENIRTTGRMFVFVLMGLSMLFAYGYVELMKNYAKSQWKMALTFLLVVMMEFWVAPMATMSVSYSPFYDQIAKDQANYKLIEIPGSTDYGFASYELFLSTVHHKGVLNGMPLARKISKEFAQQQETPVVKQLLYTIPKGNDPDKKNAEDILPSFDWKLANQVLSYHNVRYITISKKYTKPAVLKLEEHFIQKYLAFTNRFEDDYLVAYEVVQQNPDGFYAMLTGDAQLSKTFTDSSDGKLYRVLGNGAGIKVVNMNAQAQKVKITLHAKNSNDPLNFSMAGSAMQTATNAIQSYSFDVTLKSGENNLLLTVTDAQGKNVNMSNSKKLRRGLMVSDVTITKE